MNDPDATTSPRASRSSWLFLNRFLRDPRSVGAIAPSSRFLARQMVAAAPWQDGERIVEFGPGTGSFTREILARLPRSARYLGIEIDPTFVSLLRREFPQAVFVADSVTRLREIAAEANLPTIDHVISGLPFASLPGSVTHDILDALSETLRPGGTFTTFQYLHALALPSARSFRSRMRERFGGCAARSVELRNLPPAYVFTWRKPADGGQASPR